MQELTSDRRNEGLIVATRPVAAPILSIGDADLRRLARPAAVVLALGLLVYLAGTWSGYGVAADEPERQRYGRLLLDFLRSGFSDTGLLLQAAQITGGGLFDLLAATLEALWHGPVWDLRHLLSGVWGLAGMLAVWRLAKLLGGETAALLAVVILALTGAWTGALFTHTREIPLAASMSWALYFLTRLVAGWPRLDPLHAFGFGASAGAALAIGNGAWSMPVCLVLSLLVTSRRARSVAAPGQRRVLRVLAPGLVAGLVLVALGRPVLWPGLAAAEVSAVVPTLVDGRLLLSSEVPRSYLHDYLVVKLPELMLIGLALALGGRPWRTDDPAAAARERPMVAPHGGQPVHLPLALAITLPMAYAWLLRPALADGLRQFLFLLPPLAVAAALGWRLFWQALRGNAVAAWSVAAVAGLLVAIHMATLMHLQPYGHVFYNSLAGGLRGAAQGWVLDYNASSLRENVAYLEQHYGFEADGARVAVLVCGDPDLVRAWLPSPLEATRDASRADFLIAAGRPGCRERGAGEVIHAVSRRGVVLGQVVALHAARPPAATPNAYSTTRAGRASP